MKGGCGIGKGILTSAGPQPLPHHYQQYSYRPPPTPFPGPARSKRRQRSALRMTRRINGKKFVSRLAFTSSGGGRPRVGSVGWVSGVGRGSVRGSLPRSSTPKPPLPTLPRVNGTIPKGLVQGSPGYGTAGYRLMQQELEESHRQQPWLQPPATASGTVPSGMMPSVVGEGRNGWRGAPVFRPVLLPGRRPRSRGRRGSAT